MSETFDGKLVMVRGECYNQPVGLRVGSYPIKKLLVISSGEEAMSEPFNGKLVMDSPIGEWGGAALIVGTLNMLWSWNGGSYVDMKHIVKKVVCRFFTSTQEGYKN